MRTSSSYSLTRLYPDANLLTAGIILSLSSGIVLAMHRRQWSKYRRWLDCSVTSILGVVIFIDSILLIIIIQFFPRLKTQVKTSYSVSQGNVVSNTIHTLYRSLMTCSLFPGRIACCRSCTAQSRGTCVDSYAQSCVLCAKGSQSAQTNVGFCLNSCFR